MPPAVRRLCDLADKLSTTVHSFDTGSSVAAADVRSTWPDELDTHRTSGFRFVSAPLPGPMPATFAMPPALGVTVHAPYFMPTFFGLQVPAGASVQDVLQAVVSLGKLPHPALDTVIPVTNQRFDTAMSFLAYPSCIGLLDPPQCAVLLDLTRVGGHYHSAVLPCALSRHALLEHIETLIWHDTGEVELWVDGADFPASHGLLAVANGSVLTVLLRGHHPSRFVAPSDVLRPTTEWGPFEQSPSPRRQAGEAFVNSRGVVKLRYNLLSDYSPESSIRRALDLGPLDFLLHTKEHMQLDVNGDHCHSVFAGPSSAYPWLLDMRLLGLTVRIFFGRAEPTVADIVQCEPSVAPLQARLRLHCSASTDGSSPYLPVVEVTLASQADFSVAVLPARLDAQEQPWDDDREDPVPQVNQSAADSIRECKTPSEATPSLLQAAASEAVAMHAGILPAPFLRIGEAPPVQALILPDEGGDDEADEGGRTVPATVLLFAYEYTTEVVKLQLPVPCTVEDVVSLLADTCDYRRYSLLPLHVPVDPQPSQWWLAFLALPAWAQEEPILLLNLSEIDGRCFAATAPSPFRRDQILRLAQLEDQDRFEVFAFNAYNPMAADEEVALVPGGTVTIRFAGARRVVQGHSIFTMLLSGSTWDESPEIPVPPVSNRGLLVHGHGHGVIHPRSGGVVPSAEEVAALCGTTAASVRIVAADPMPTDVACHGFHCQHVFGVTFIEDNELVQGDDKPCVSFIDCRLLFQGWSLECSATGQIDHAELVDWLDTFSPPDWQPQLLNVSVDNGLVQSNHGGVIVAEYVPLTTSEEPHGHSGSDGSPPPNAGPDEDPEDGSESSDLSSDSAEEGDAREGTAPPRQPERSRSPRRGEGNATSHVLAHCHARVSICGSSDNNVLLQQTTCWQLLMWIPVFLQGAVAHGRLVFTSVLLLALIPCVFATHFPPSNPAVPLAVPFLFALCLLECYRALCAFANRYLRLLVEPNPASVEGRVQLAVLRYFAPRLGAPWRYSPSQSALWIVDEESSGAEDTDTDEQVVDVPLFVLAPGFSGERLIVPLRLPATPAEIALGVQAGRTREQVWHFPRLIAADPQPFPGVGVLLSCPAWHSDMRSSSVFVCIDTVQIDGRAFVLLVPNYMHRHQLIVVANLPPSLPVDVYVGASRAPLEEQAWCNLAAGDTVSFCPEGEPRTAVLTLDQLLSPNQVWSDSLTLPGQGATSSYCLVHDDGTVLHTANYGAPTAYRAQIAAALGIKEQGLQLYPAQPRVADACLDGVICRTVTAARDTRSSSLASSFGVILDLRFLLLGWRILHVTHGQVDHVALLAVLGVDAPLGWSVALREIAPDVEQLDVSPGQVLVAVLRPAVSPPERQHVAGHSASGSDNSVPAGQGDTSLVPAPSADASGVGAASSTSAPVQPDNPASPEVTSGETISAWDVEEFAELHFLVLTPEYASEHVTLQTRLPLTIVESIALVSARRVADRAALFPRLIAVPVQPALPAACILAMPPWEPDGVPVVIVSYVPPLRVFAQCVPTVLDVESVLRIARIGDNPQARVFVSDTPWPVERDAPFHVDVGDLVLVLPTGHPVIPPLRLRTMLASAAGWHTEPVLPAPEADALWVVTDQAPIRFVTPPPPRPPVRADIARFLGLSEHELHFIPADPAIRDHTRGGFPSRQIFIAALAAGGEGTPFVLDLRPILICIDWDRAPQGQVDVARLCARHRSRCPPGYFIRVHGGYADGDTANHYRHVLPGQIITLEFWPRWDRLAVVSGVRASEDADNVSDDDPPSGPGTGTASASPPDSRARHDAGTGGTLHVGTPSARVATLVPELTYSQFGESGKWSVGILQDAFLDGVQRLTSAYLPFTLSVFAWCARLYRPSVHTPDWALPSVAFGCVLALPAILHRLVLFVAGRRVVVCTLLVLVLMPSCASGVQVFNIAAGDASPRCGRLSEPSGLGFGPDAVGIEHVRLRPVATPCRAFGSVTLPVLPRSVVVPPASSGHADSSDLSSFVAPLRTLLEESRDADPHSAFFEARVLVETLVEHCCEDSGASLPKRQPTQLVLSALLDMPHADGVTCPPREPVQWYNLDDNTCATPLTSALVADLGRFCPISQIRALPTCLERPERFQRWVDAGAPGNFPSDALSLCLTSDGSYFASSGAAGWGVVLSVTTSSFPSAPGVFVGAICGPTDELWAFGGDDAGPVNAYASEIVGLLWAAVVAYQCKFQGPVAFFCDNLAALGAADSTCACPTHPVARACQDLHQGLAFSAWGAPSYAHVRGHSGDTANELADAVAGFGASKGTVNPFSIGFRDWFAADAFRWVPHFRWAACFPTEGPRLKNGTITWSSVVPPALLDPDDVLAPFTRAFPGPPKQGAGVFSTVHFVVATFNTLSIVETGKDTGRGAGLYGCTGRVALLDGALHKAGVFLAGLQETRTPEGRGQSTHFARYSSGCHERRALGVELWVAVGSSWPSHTAVVLHSDPTRLCARVVFADVHVCVLVAHALHAGHSFAERSLWWAATEAVCSRVGFAERWILLVDANCKVGHVCSPSIGSLHADPVDDVGEIFHALLRKCETWLPSTFADSFYGDGGTLVQKRSGGLVRSDYVALPLEWRSSAVQGHVAPEISAGHAVIDHFAVLVDIEMRVAADKPRRGAPRIDTQALVRPENAAAVQRICETVPHVDWQTSVHDHSAIVVDALYRGLAEAFPLKGRRLGKHFLSEETAAAHQGTSVLRHALRWRLLAYRSAITRCAFTAWTQHVAFADIFVGRWLHQLRLSIAGSSARLGLLGKAVRRLCRRDRAAYFSSLAEEADSAPPGQIHLAIKKVLRPKKFRKGGAQPLPKLTRPDGSLCTTSEQVSEEWRRHFAALEGGQVTGPDDLVRNCVARQCATGPSSGLSEAELPSFGDLVRALKGMQPFRAAGPDLVPPSICARFALPVARLLWPLLLKGALLSAEGIGMKGGTLHHIAKASSHNSSLASAQRGILLQPVFSKAIHKTMRRLPATLFEGRALDLQLGGRKGLSYEFGHFMSRNFLLYARMSGQSAALVFSDLAAAYYAVVREVITGARGNADPLTKVTASLGFSAEVLQEIQYHAINDPILDGRDCSRFLQSLMHELHTDTWFHISGDPTIVRTTRGTRPGSSIADVAFNLLFERVLARRGTFSSDVTPVLHWSGIRALRPYSQREHGTAHAVRVQDIVYADDHAACVVARNAAHLVGAVSHVMGRSLDAITSHGLSANIGPKKTAALLVHRGQGAKAARDALFCKNRAKITVLREYAEPVKLDAVPTYRHLGSIISYNGSVLADVRARVSRAKAEFGEGRKRVFCCPQIQLGKRVILFQQHVLSALFAGAGAWPTLCQGSWTALEQCLTSLHRQMLRLRGPEVQHCTRDEVFVACNASDPFDLLCLERLRFLGRLLRSGPDAAWALLQNSPEALTALQSACDWCQQALEHTCDVGCFREEWPAWQKLITSRPRLWKGLLKRAAAWHRGRRALSVRWSAFVRSTWATRPAPAADPGLFQHACLICRRAFPTSQSWASHAALKHGFRTRHFSLAEGKRCRACGATFSCTRRLRNHLGTSRICLQAIEDDLPCLLPMLSGPDSHVQCRAQPGHGTGHLPDVRPEIVSPLLTQLSELVAGDDEAIFAIMSQHVAPFSALRDTLQHWVSSLPPGALRDAAEDVLLCCQVELLCDTAIEAGTSRHAVLDPLVMPLVWAPRPAGLPGLVCGAAAPEAASALGISPGGGWRVYPFWLLPPKGCSFAGALVVLPSPPIAFSPFWSVPSCTLRTLRRHVRWLDLCLSWTAAVVSLAASGRRCHLVFGCSRTSAVELHDWLLACRQTVQDITAFSFRFTS